MKFILGSASTRKIDTVNTVIASIISEPFTLDAKDVASGVPSTPWNEQIKLGASNRAQALSDNDLAYAIGLESGLVERFGDIYEESWACVIHKNIQYFGYSSGLKLPDFVIERMQQFKLEHGPTLRQIRKELHVENDKDTWGLYSNFVILRQVSLEEALRNALIQIFVPGSLYSKSVNQIGESK